MSQDFFLRLLAAAVVMCIIPGKSMGEGPAVTGVRIDGLDRLVVSATVPPGFRHAVLEIRTGAAAAWRSMIAGQIDGRPGSLLFRCPLPADASALLARVRVGVAAVPPAVELNDPDLFAVGYDPEGGPISEGTKLRNLSDLMRKRHEWRSLSSEQRTANLIAHALTLPRVSDAGYSALARSVYLNYPDGDASLIIDQRPGEATLGLGLPSPDAVGDDAVAAVPARQNVVPAGEADVTPGRTPRGATALRLPQSIDAVCAYALEPQTFPDSTPEVARWLGAAGYSVRRYRSTTVDDLISWGNRKLGVLFWQTHAGSLRRPKNGPEEMCIMTGHEATEELSQGRYKTMRSGPVWELLLASRPDLANPANTAGIPIYSVTRAFIENEMRGMLAPHSFFALDACTGASPELADPFIDDGAGTFVSWDALSGTGSGEPFRKIFDRLLGRNEEPPVSSPKERPFPIQTTQKWMRDQDYDIDPSPLDPDPGATSARLVWYHHGQAPGYALLPSIFRVLYETNDQQFNFTKMLIEGDFGIDPGPTQRLVAWGDRVVQILDWREDIGIRVKPPPPPYPTGDLQVIIGNRYSNRVPLTEWTIPFTFVLTGEGTLQYTIELNVKLRADVRRFRAEPESPPRTSPMAMWQLADCTGSVTASGLYKPSPSTTVRWSGGSSLVSVDPLPSDRSDLITAGGTINLITGAVANFMLSATGSFTQTTNDVAETMGATLDGYMWPPLPLSFDPVSLVIPGKSPEPLFPPSIAYGVSSTLRWPSVQPAAAPTLDTPR